MSNNNHFSCHKYFYQIFNITYYQRVMIDFAVTLWKPKGSSISFKTLQNMNPSYSISKPCSEDWNKMTTEEQGRHCQVCCKTVVDFSKRSSNEIVDFLQKSISTKICGRFRKEQLMPQPKREHPKSRHRIFFAALVFVFGGMLFSSCGMNNPKHEELMGDVAYTPDTLQPKNNPDTTSKKIVIPDTAHKTGMNSKKEIKAPVVIPEVNEFRMGDVAYVPDPLK